VLRDELTAQLRSERVHRRPQRRVSAGRPGRIANMVPIHDRPAEVVPANTGHWAGDLLVGRYSRGHLVTLVERHSRYLLVLALTDAKSSTVVAAPTEHSTICRRRCAGR
jgi:IS30 family transposase